MDGLCVWDVLNVCGCGYLRVKVGRLRVGAWLNWTGTIETLKHLKKDTNEVRKGTECGISFHGFTDVKEGDEIIAFTKFEVARHL